MTSGLRRAVFLDRDGVIDRAVVRGGKPYPPESLEAVVIPAEVPPALQALRVAGYLLVVVTNQPDVTRGKQRREVVEAIHQHLRARLPLDDIYVCYHDDRDRCNCRKPQPGMILEAARQHRVDLTASFMIGDRGKDIEAGSRAGCRTVWIDYGYDEPGPAMTPDRTVRSLAEAVDWILTAQLAAG